jgi:CubicO group peptidase (beta-lactamase class C family)
MDYPACVHDQPLIRLVKADVPSCPRSTARTARHRHAICLGLLWGLGIGGDVSGLYGRTMTFPAADLRAIDDAMRTAIVEKQTPGGVLWMEQGTRRYVHAYGNRACEPIPEPATQDTIYDAASLTKVVATTPAVLLLVQRKQLALDTPVMNYWPEFGREGKETITIRHLLTHTAGLRAGLNQSQEWTGYRAAMDMVCGEIPMDSPGSVFRYSDINFIVLGELVRRVSGQPLDEFAAREIFRPLKMHNAPRSGA